MLFFFGLMHGVLFRVAAMSQMFRESHPNTLQYVMIDEITTNA